MDIHKVIGKFPRPKRGFVLPYHKYTWTINTLGVQSTIGWTGAIQFCGRDIDVAQHLLQRQHTCDDEMLKELDVLEPKGI